MKLSSNSIEKERLIYEKQKKIFKRKKKFRNDIAMNFTYCACNMNKIKA